MTALDDALNSSSIVWGTHSLWAYWRELDNGDIGTNVDSPSDLSDQMSGAVTIAHALDDGLPDAVTMTSDSAASGTLVATLNGKTGLTYGSSGQRAYTSDGQYKSSTTVSTQTEEFNSTTYITSPGWFTRAGTSASGEWWGVVQQQSGTMTITVGASDTGSELRFTTTSTPTHAQLEFGMSPGNTWVPLTAGLGSTQISMTARVRFDQPNLLPDNCRPGIVFEDASGIEIVRYFGNTANSQGQYISISATTTVPPNAVLARADIQVDFLDTSAQTTVFHLDQVVFQIGTNTDTMTGAIPSNTQRGDYLLSAVLIDDPSASVIQTNADDPKDAWDYLGQVSTGVSGLGLWLFGTPNYYPGRPGLRLQGDRNFGFTIMTTAFWAKNPNGIPLNYRIRQIDTKSETVSGTSHSITSTLLARGYQLSVWATNNRTWTPGTGLTEWGEVVNGALDMALNVSGLLDSGVYTNTATTSSATAVALMAVLNLEPYARPTLDARQYFSPFNTSSPLYGFDRDTANTLFTFNTLTASGPVGTILHSGIMSDLPIKERQAELDATSETRINLNASVTLPVVYAYREGCTTDWLLTWLLSRGGRYVGPAPTIYTRAWAPLHGSVHAHIEGPYTYNYMLSMFSTSPGTWFGHKNPVGVPGPFLTGMFADQTATDTHEVKLVFTRPDLNVNPLQLFQPDPSGGTTPVNADIFSQTNTRGRVTFWLRGDAVQSAPSYMTTLTDNDFIFNFYLYVQDTAGNYLGYVRFGVRSADRYPEVIMGSAAVGGPSGYFYSGSGALNTAGTWDFYALHWDLAAGEIYLVRNGTEIHSTSFATAGLNLIAQLPKTDAEGIALGYTTSLIVRSHVPISEFMYDAGAPYVAGQWARWYSAPVSPGATVVTRPVNQKIEVIANPTPLTVWDTIADLAQATLSMYRANELDSFEFLPLSYFGETAQMTAGSIVDVNYNAEDLDVTLDPSKSRNVVTVEFQDTSVTSNPSPILTYSQSISIPRGNTTITFTLDTLAAEIHWQSAPFSAQWQLTNLTATQITTPTIPTGVHYAAFNTASDGSGTVLDSSKVFGRILYGDASTVTIQFTNRSGTTAYLANNGQSVPFMLILGYAITANDGYSTARDPGSIGIRRERGLSTELDWIQDRQTASDIAALLAAMLSRPRAQLEVVINGDPRRKPGQMVTIKDAEGTQAAGTWRVLAATHNINGAQYTTTLLLVYVGPVLNWDDPTTTWDNAVWGP